MNLTNRKLFCLFLIMGIGISCLATLPGCSGSKAPPAKAMDEGMASYITPDATAAGVIYPQSILSKPDMDADFVKTITDSGQKDLGFDPKDI